MKVKLESFPGVVFDSEVVPIAILLSDADKFNISHMAEDAHVYCSYPNTGFTVEDILEFMKELKK